MDLKFTPTQQKIINILADGLQHTREEIASCLWDEMGERNNIHMHITNIRKIIRPHAQDILCKYGVGYRLVRLIGSPHKE